MTLFEINSLVTDKDPSVLFWLLMILIVLGIIYLARRI